jgi:tetratricopeptide (TPR) repeat protein
MVHHILRNNRDASGGWKKKPYFAVTVPNDMGYEKYFTLEGLVNRVNPDTLQPDVDAAAVSKALYETFKYRGLFRADGSWDPGVYKDENAATLSRNYASAHLQLAFWYRRNGELPRAVREMERIARMFPDMTQVLVPLGTFYLDAGDTTKATELFQRLTQQFPQDPEGHYYYGVTQIYRGNVAAAVQEFERAIQLEPGYTMAYYAAFYALSESGQREQAIAYLQRLVDARPDDPQARQMLESQRALLGGDLGSRRLLPRPPLPSLR